MAEAATSWGRSLAANRFGFTMMLLGDLLSGDNVHYGVHLDIQSLEEQKSHCISLNSENILLENH
ncbi:hypothetical protein [Sphingobacterium daejeonense]|uniref:hypothetical protein n=1 Tax=Sphingobacterium daejeonense TaxID=371142 RepID=UPI0010FE0974|nr:hypothetical protein [Sphingobacterium daejeonense]